MKTENNTYSFEIATIILSYLQEQISDEDRLKLDSWLDESEANSSLFARIVSDKSRNQEVKKLMAYNTDSAWENVNRKVRKKRDRRIFNGLKVAAGVVVLLGIVMLFRLEAPENVMVAEAGTESIHPGYAIAKLTVGTGETYILDSLTSADIPNTTIRNGKEIVYNNSDTAVSGNAVYNKIEIPRGGEYKITLPDGTEVYLNSQTELRFPDNFNNSPERIVYVSGEAFFKVKKNEKQPFIVKCRDYNVRVLGTTFNISDYSDDNYSHTTLAEGKVELNFDGHNILLKPGQQARLQAGSIKVKEVNVENYTTWMNENFRFESESIEEILKRIARWYVVDVFYVNQSVKNYHFSGYLPRYANISEALDLLGLTTDIRFEVKDKTILVMKK